MAKTTNLQLNLPIPLEDYDQWPFDINENFEILDIQVAARLAIEGGAMEGPIGIAAGTVNIPSLYLVGSAKTGLYGVAANEMGVAVNEQHAGKWRNREYLGYDLGFTNELIGYVGSVSHFKTKAYQLDADNGGTDLYVRKAGNFLRAARLSKDGYLGLGHDYGSTQPAAMLDLAGNTCTFSSSLGSGSELNLSIGNFFHKTITAPTTFSSTGWPALRLSGFSLELTNPGAHALTFPETWVWDGNVQPAWVVAGKARIAGISRNGGATIDVWCAHQASA